MQSIKQQLQTVQTLQELENLKVQMSGKKGVLTLAFAQLKNLEGEEKKQKAQELNLLKQEFESI